ncbi:MAG: hypothetical protein C5B52_17430 [Bacteroidetes bacterium]|nr:MAG: hypothetical protein C5B52_17430 [Bacteroidota bacterium]
MPVPKDDPKPDFSKTVKQLDDSWELAKFTIQPRLFATYGHKTVGGKDMVYVDSINWEFLKSDFAYFISDELKRGSEGKLNVDELPGLTDPNDKILKADFLRILGRVRIHAAEHFTRYRQVIADQITDLPSKFLNLPDKNSPSELTEQDLDDYMLKYLQFLFDKLTHDLWKTTCEWEKKDYPNILKGINSVKGIFKIDCTGKAPGISQEPIMPVVVSGGKAKPADKPTDTTKSPPSKGSDSSKTGPAPKQKIQKSEDSNSSGSNSNLINGSAESQLNQSSGNGNTLSPNVKGKMENSFGRDFSCVRIHDDSNSAQMARDLNAQAFTYGNDIYFNSGKYDPENKSGQHLLAHELTHVVQQTNNPTIARKIQRKSIADFKSDLEKMSADHKIVVDDLFADPAFTPLVDYLNKCPGGTIDFDVKRHTQMVRGKVVDLFGGFEPKVGTPSSMIVNPFRAEHKTNPLEVVDTIVHEFLHAILDLDTKCTSPTNPFPLSSGITDAPHDPELAGLFSSGIRDPLDRKNAAAASAGGMTTTSGQNLTDFLGSNYGPSASRPKTHYVDLNRKGLELVTSIIAGIKARHPTIGKETVSFDNVELMKASDLLATRNWWNATQRSFSMGLHKDRVANKRNVEAATFTPRDYDISAIQVVEFADSFTFDPNLKKGWGPVGGVWECHKKSRFTGKTLHTYVTGVKSTKPGGAVDYKIIQHT